MNYKVQGKVSTKDKDKFWSMLVSNKYLKLRKFLSDRYLVSVYFFFSPFIIIIIIHIFIIFLIIQ